MNLMQFIVPAITAIVGGGLGYLIKYLLAKKSESETRVYKDKHEHYSNLILCLKSLREGKTTNINLFFFEYNFIWLNASDKVIHAANKIVERLTATSKLSRDDQNLIGELLVELRRDIGFSSTFLKANDYLYLFDE